MLVQKFAGQAAAGPTAEQAVAAAASAEGQEACLVRAPVKHVLSQELQLYFDTVAHLLRAKSGILAVCFLGSGIFYFTTPSLTVFAVLSLKRSTLACSADDFADSHIAQMCTCTLQNGVRLSEANVSESDYLCCVTQCIAFS